jgi:hypothetical protein
MQRHTKRDTREGTVNPQKRTLWTSAWELFASDAPSKKRHSVLILTAPLRKRDKEGSTVITMKRKEKTQRGKETQKERGGA